MHWAFVAILWVCLPFWLALAAIFLVVALMWGLLGTLLDREIRTGLITSVTLVLLLLGAGLSIPSPWTPWHISVMDCGVASASVCAVVCYLRRWPNAIPQSVHVAALLIVSLYVIAKSGLVSKASQPPAIAVALLVFSALLPIAQVVAIYKLWRYANVEACSFVCRQLFLEVVRSPFSIDTIEGLHTVKFHKQKSDVPASSSTSMSCDSSTGILFLHGYAAGSIYFAFNIDAAVRAAGNASVFALDWRGFAASAREPFTPRTTSDAETWFVDSLEQWRISQGLERLICIGHSLGGYLSAAYALRHPQRVAALILVSPAGIASTGSPELDNLRTHSGDGVVDRSPPRIPAWIKPVISFAWNSGMTPGVLLRSLGPLGPCFARRVAVRRMSRMTLEKPLSPSQMAMLGTYFYHSNASDGSGEFALRHLLGPGARAYDAVGERLIKAAGRAEGDPLRLSCRVTFIYGATHDWMSSESGEKVVSALSVAGICASLHRVGPAGHHVYLEAASGVNAILRTEISASLQETEQRHEHIDLSGTDFDRSRSASVDTAEIRS